MHDLRTAVVPEDGAGPPTHVPADRSHVLGPITAIHVAPGARLPMQGRAEVTLEGGPAGTPGGIVGDRYHGSRHRHVTVQTLSELALAAAELGRPIDPAGTRRNVTLARGSLARKPGTRMLLGAVELEVVRDAAPCKLLDDALGRDAKLALHKRAGVVCRVLRGGELRVGDGAAVLPDEPPAAPSHASH